MTESVGLPPPGVILILGGLLLPLLRGAAPAAALLLPLLTLGAIWGIPGDLEVSLPFMGQTLEVLSWQPATRVFATIFALMAFGGALFAHPITGLHSERWTREQAIAYMMRETGMGEAETVTEIERYIVDPGQALAYKVGMLKILELRERARSALGSRFDIREFHDQVLLNGALPLAVLERVVDDYIANRRKAG